MTEPAPRAGPVRVFGCPVCGAPLLRTGSAERCASGHLFDVAREGYVNLLLPQHRHSKDPGYSQEMIRGRRDFFESGHYQPLADDIAGLIADRLPKGRQRVVLDAGCGEGYYLRRLRSELQRRGREEETLLCGLDISKHGIRVAARRDPLGQYAVAGSHRMPVLPASVDVLLTHFSPVSAEDFAAAVRPGGVVLVGGPGADHLFSLKQLLYERPARHQPAAHLVGDPRFELVETLLSRHPIALRGAGQIRNLLGMTPYFWTLDAEARDRLGQLEQLDTEIDVEVRAYRRTDVATSPGVEPVG